MTPCVCVSFWVGGWVCAWVCVCPAALTSNHLPPPPHAYGIPFCPPGWLPCAPSGIIKDVNYATWFGKPGDKPYKIREVPARTWVLFACRDVMTIGAGFVFPKMVTNWALENRITESRRTAEVLSKLTVPCLFQVFLTPVHTLALDFHNHRTDKMAERAPRLVQKVQENLGSRVLRVLVIYGVAGCVGESYGILCLLDAQSCTPPHSVGGCRADGGGLSVACFVSVHSHHAAVVAVHVPCVLNRNLNAAWLSWFRGML